MFNNRKFILGTKLEMKTVARIFSLDLGFENSAELDHIDLKNILNKLYEVMNS